LSVLSKYKKLRERIKEKIAKRPKEKPEKPKKVEKPKKPEMPKKVEKPIEPRGPPVVSTSIPGLDEVIGGGLPEKSVVMLAGSAGTGKTTLAAQYIHGGATKHDEKGLYVCLSETKEKFLSNMMRFGWDFEGLEKAGKVTILDLATAREVELQNNLNMIMREINDRKPRRVVIDPLTAMTSAMETRIDARFLTHVLYKFLQGANCTAIFIAEVPSGSDFIGSGVEEFIADGVFVLRQAEKEDEITRELEIMKLRGVEIKDPTHPFTLLGGPRILSKSVLVGPVMEALKRLRFGVESPGFLKGKSGARHSFDIVATIKGKTQSTLAIDVAASSKVIGKSPVMSVFAKESDIGKHQSVLIAIPRLSGEGRRLAKAYKVTVIEAKDADEVVRKLTTFSKNLIKRK
jgi:circadian clock protein KaiC